MDYSVSRVYSASDGLRRGYYCQYYRLSQYDHGKTWSLFTRRCYNIPAL